MARDPYEHPEDWLWRFQCHAVPGTHKHSFACFAPAMAITDADAGQLELALPPAPR